MNTSDTSEKSALRAAIRARRTARVDSSRADSGGSPDVYAAHVAELVRALRPTAVVGYAALPGEPNLDAALGLLLDTRTPVLLPATRKGEPLQLGRVTGPLDDLPRGTWGIREPAAPLPAPEVLAGLTGPVELTGTAGSGDRGGSLGAAGSGDRSGSMSADGSGDVLGAGEEQPLLVLVPGLSYDARGIRLGNGGGFYDRTFGPQGVLADKAPASLRARLRFVGVCWDEERTEDLPHADWDLAVGAILTESGPHPVSSDT